MSYFLSCFTDGHSQRAEATNSKPHTVSVEGRSKQGQLDSAFNLCSLRAWQKQDFFIPSSQNLFPSVKFLPLALRFLLILCQGLPMDMMGWICRSALRGPRDLGVEAEWLHGMGRCNMYFLFAVICLICGVPLISLSPLIYTAVLSFPKSQPQHVIMSYFITDTRAG